MNIRLPDETEPELSANARIMAYQELRDLAEARYQQYAASMVKFATYAAEVKTQAPKASRWTNRWMKVTQFCERVVEFLGASPYRG